MDRSRKQHQVPLTLSVTQSFDDITTQNGATESFYNADGSLQVCCLSLLHFHCILYSSSFAQDLKIAALSRTYAPTIAAVPDTIKYSFDASSARFSLNYTSNPDLPFNNCVTEIYLNEVSSCHL